MNLDINNLDYCFDKALEVIKNYMGNICTDPVIPNIDRDELKKIISSKMPHEGLGVENVIEDVQKNVVPYCTKIGNPKFLSWIITNPSPAGTIGELINVGLNQVPFCFKSGPAATVIEEIVISWFLKMFGYNEQGGGILVSGGSTGTLTALTAAREHHVPGSMQDGLQKVDKPLIVYTSMLCHKSVDTAVSTIGIGSKYIRKIPVDANYKLDVVALKQQIETDRKLGYDPFCVVAQAGTSNEGAVDDIDAIANLCESEKLWLHVDAAYAGGAILTKRGQQLMKGIEKADSISTDPHKWFFIPVEACCVLVKNRKHLYDTFKAGNNDFGWDDPIEFMNYGIQFTRMSRAFKVWFAFRSYGLKTLEAVIDKNLDLTEYFADTIALSDEFELSYNPQTSAVCFRYIPDCDCSINQLNNIQIEIVKRLEESSRAFLANAVVDSKTVIRACFSNHRTTKSDIKELYSLLQSISEDVSEDLLVQNMCVNGK